MTERGSDAALIAGRFRVTGVLGQGAMGVVYRAYDEVLARELALKEMRVPAGVDVGEALERFVTEARAAARLSDPAIVTVHDVIQDGDRVLIAMEVLNGATLAEALGMAPGGIAPDQVREVMTAVAGALAAAHRQGVVHRDLKPDNIFWLESGRVVVTDFGLARIGAGRGTQLGTVMGTPGYMAPEQIRGDQVGPAADVFAWGAIAHELLVGAPAFGGPELEATTLMWNVVNESAAPIDVPADPALAAVIDWALQKDPAARPADGDMLLDALRGMTATLPPATSGAGAPRHPSTPPTAPATPKRRSTGMYAGLAAAALTVAAGATALVLVLTNNNDTAPAMTQIATRQTQPTSQTATTTDTDNTTTAAPTTPPSTPLQVASSTASSSRDSVFLRCTDAYVPYTSENLHDGDLNTGWGTTPGDGIGHYVVLDLGRKAHITSVGLTPGYAKVGPRQSEGCQTVEAFHYNRFVKKVRYDFDDGSSVVQRFRPSPDAQRTKVDARSRRVRITIMATRRPPGADDDTILSEVDIRGYR